jgi:hypothetical protein
MKQKAIGIVDTESVSEPTAAEQEAADINALILADVQARIKSRSFKTTATVGKAGLFDVTKYANGTDYTVGGLLTIRWCSEDPQNVANKRMKGFMFPEEVSPRLKNITQNGLVLMVRTKEAANAHRAQLRELTQNLDGQEFESSPLVADANAKAKSKNGKVFREFEKIEAS